MKAWIGVAVFCVAGGIALLSRGADEESGSSYSADQGLVAHEWGVIHMNAHGGAVADVLPDFVHRNDADSAPNMQARKPVVYFYSPKEETVKVSLQLSRGGVFAWYPGESAAASREIEESGERRRKSPAAELRALMWGNLKLAVKSGAKLPDAPKGHWWADCRVADACTVTSGGESEKFLFYEAADVWPVEIQHAGTAEISPPEYEFTNLSKRDLTDVFLFAGELTGFSGVLPAGKKSGVGAVKDRLAAAKKQFRALLVKSGLYDKEADAFMACWDKTLFSGKGTRVIYRLPEEEWNKVASLAIEPKPKSVKRVMFVAVEFN